MQQANVSHDLPKDANVLPPPTGSETAVAKQAERRIARLEAELRSVDRALKTSKEATGRCERSLAGELYYQHLLAHPKSAGLAAAAAVTASSGSAPAATPHEKAMRALREMRVEVAEEVAKMSEQLEIAMRTRAEGQQAKLREQISGCARRLLLPGAEADLNSLLRTMRTASAPPAHGAGGKPPAAAALERAKGRLELVAPGMDTAALAASIGAAKANLGRPAPPKAQKPEEEAEKPADPTEARSHVLEGLLEALTEKIHNKPPGRKRSLQASLRLTRTLDTLRMLKAADEGGS